jgi:hypothetical protein
MWITLWIDVDKQWISCGSHAIQIDFSSTLLFLLGFPRPLCTQSPQNQHPSPNFVDKSAEIVRFFCYTQGCAQCSTFLDALAKEAPSPILLMRGG